MALFLLLAHSSTAQVITGKVIDAVSLQPLESAIVYDPADPGTIAFTDQLGNFSIRINKADNGLRVSYIGYKAVSVPVAEANMQVRLQPDVIKLNDVIIAAQDNHRRFNTLAKADLDLKPVKSTQELLRAVPGLFVAQHAGGGKAEQVFLRGFDIDHGTDLRVSVDDMPVNMVSHAHGQGYADAHFIIPETIMDIDFGTGPYYSSQGNLNTAGYVNFRTYRSIAGSRIQLEAGRFNSYRALVMADLLKKNKEKQNAYLAGEYSYTNGPTLSPQDFHRANIFGKYNLQLSSGSGISLSLSAFDSKWKASGQVPERSVAAGVISRFGSIDPTEGGKTSRYNASAAFHYRLTGTTSLETRLYYSRYLFDLFSNFSFYLNDPVNGDGIRQKEKRDILGMQSVLRSRDIYSAFSLNSQYGVGIRYDHIKGSELSRQVQRIFLAHSSLGDIKETNAFAFIQQQFATGKWILELGARLDHLVFDHKNILNGENLPSVSKAILSPKINLRYNLNKVVQLYAKAGKGFHSNDARVVVAEEGKQVLPAAYGADLGLSLYPSQHFFMNIALWHLYLRQEFVYVGDEGITEPGGRTIRKGIDLLARWQVTDHLFASMNLNVTKANALDAPRGNGHIPLAPLFTSTGGVFYKAKNGFNGGLNYRYMQNRPANEDNSVVAKGYFIVDGALNFTTSKYETGIAVENIFNTKWNEAQFATESRLKHEAEPVTELHFTPGMPFFLKIKLAVFF